MERRGRGKRERGRENGEEREGENGENGEERKRERGRERGRENGEEEVVVEWYARGRNTFYQSSKSNIGTWKVNKDGGILMEAGGVMG
ncbi:hypothetical protein Pmani_035850 [Petrolisthes manimaculis]|uniref:Uncharacterized protein n=1 Tax=Petrolisthes manimaculis TaxID=1843537 RepID=A0AAE1NKU0_9EUCA|nr:hypothetical protein Pmani_035850 [Petrolisthes manimaculis]